MKTVVHGFGLFLDDGVVDDTDHSGVVSLDWRRRLGPAHFDECLAKGYHFFGGDKEGTNFGFCSRRHDKFDDLGDGENGTIEAWKRVIF